MPVSISTVDDADGVGAGHRRILHLLHDDEAGVGVGMVGGQDQVAVGGRVAARLAQHAQAQIVGVSLAGRRIFSNMVSPGTSSTPPVITRPGSPQACASTAVIMLENRNL